jgi:hypothetical protein
MKRVKLQQSCVRGVRASFICCRVKPSLDFLQAFLIGAFLAGFDLKLVAQPSGGTVNFGNDNTAKVINGPTGNPVASSNNVQAALYWAPLDSTNFLQIGAAISVGVPLDGLFAGGTRTTDPGSPGGSSAQFQVRAWGGGYATYEEAAQHYGVLIGTSAIIPLTTGNPDGDPPTPPPSLVANGLQSFAVNPKSSDGPPVIICGSNKTVSCSDIWIFDAPSASDPCSGTNLTISITGTLTNGQCPQLITRTWSVTGVCNTNSATCSQTVTVVDTEPPVLNCIGSKTVNCGSSWSFDPPTASDLCSGTNVTISLLGTLTNGFCPQVITRTWLATDACANTNTCSQTITVADLTPPLMSCADNKTVNCATNWTFDPPAAFDSCAGSNVTVALLNTMTSGVCPLVMTSTWLATNGCGHSNTCSQTVTVLCADCPVIALSRSCPAYPVPPGGLLSFSGTVSNLADVTLTNVLVVGDQPAPNTILFGPATLAAGAVANFTGSYSVAACCGPYTNTLTASGTTPYGLSFTNLLTVACPGTNYSIAGDLNGDGIVDQSELNAVLANYWLHSPWIYMTNPASLGGGMFQFALTNASAWNFTVLVSSNLADWTDLPGPAYPVYQFFDPEAASNAPMRAYRLRWP